MTSKLCLKKNSQEKFQIMFQICVIGQKIQEKNQRYIPETFFKCNDYEHQNTQYSWNYWKFSKALKSNKFIH